MRKLIINIKQSDKCAGEKVFVFVEDINGATRISGIACTRLGDLRCGENAAYLIENGNVRLFAIPENQNSNYDYTPFRLPVGDSDINLIGEFKSSNDDVAFELQFDKSNSAVNKETAKKADAPKKASIAKRISKEKDSKKETNKETKKTSPLTVILVLIAAMLIGTLLGYTVTTSIISAKKAEPKAFSSNEFNITLNGHFTEEYIAGYSTTFASKDVAVFVTEDKFIDEESLTINETIANFSERDYLKYTLVCFLLNDVVINSDVDLYYFEYYNTNKSNGKEYLHLVYAYKYDKSFWTVEFVVKSGKANKYLDKISDWAHSVNFK
jgi:hypothetical protein